jgi:predicted nucleic acid-binding protein
MIFDTDVLIWCLRGNSRAAKVIEMADSRAISVVSYMELIQGARDRRELGLIRSFLKDVGFQMLPLTEAIGHRAAVYMEEYALKSALALADALLAGTAVESHEALCSGNAKHFRSITELELKVFRPA